MITAAQVYYCEKFSLTENSVLNYTTLGFPFITRLHSHEWNDTQALKMTAGQVYECEKFHFLKSEC